MSAQSAVVLVSARLVGAVLAGVEQVEIDQVAIARLAVNLDRGADRQGRGAQRHVLVISLRGGLAAQREERRRHIVLRPLRGPVVVHLVIVPHREPGSRGVRGHQIGVHLVLRIAAPIGGQVDHLVTEVLAHGRHRQARGIGRKALAPALVDVVAVAEHEIELLLGHAAIGGVIAGLVMLAAAHREAQLVEPRAGRRRGLCAPCQAALAAGVEAVPIGPCWGEAGHLDMHRMAKLRPGERGALLHDGGELGVRRHFPRHLHRGRRHAVADLERLGRQPRPDDEAVGRRIARGDAERERAGGEERLGQQRCRQRHGKGSHRRRAEAAQQVATRQLEPALFQAVVAHRGPFRAMPCAAESPAPHSQQRCARQVALV